MGNIDMGRNRCSRNWLSVVSEVDFASIIHTYIHTYSYTNTHEFGMYSCFAIGYLEQRIDKFFRCALFKDVYEINSD
jgi:hypothetical protein